MLRLRGMAAAAGLVVALVVALLGGAPTAAASPAPAPAGPTLTVTPSAGLSDGQSMSLVSTGTTPGSTFLFVECGPTALKIFTGQLPPDTNPNDGCEQQRSTVLRADAAGVVAGTLKAAAVVSSAVGTDDCRVVQCFVALFALAGGPSVQLQNLTFAASACSDPGSCAVPSDWAPSDGARTAAAHRGPRPVTSDHPLSFGVRAGLAGDLTVAGSQSGPYTGPAALRGSTPPAAPVTGEGLVRLALASPGTSWSAASPSSTVVDVAVDGGTPQQFVLFRGGAPFVYAGFVGPLTTGSHTVTVVVDAGLSVAGASRPTVTVLARQLEVVAPTNPSYLGYAYAPVMFGRSTSALHDTPLIDYASGVPLAGGAVRLTYTVIWSHEDAGTGFVPFLLDGSWGRMTDVENAMSFTVAADGSVSDAVYLWGGQPPDYPDTQGAISETDVAFGGAFAGHHPILRDATGNNDFSDQGTTGFRFQQAPVAPPAAGQTREGAMDANPWTYQVMGEEVGRWYTDISTDPSSPQPGDARQYAYVQLGTSGAGVTSVAVDVRLSGSGKWYQSDLGGGYPLVGTGLVRTVVKLPRGWTSRSITGVRVRAFPAAAAPTVAVTSLSVRALGPHWQFSVRSTPAPSVVAGVVADPVALGLVAVSGVGQRVAAGGSVRPMVVEATDSLGDPLAGVPVTFAAGSGPALSFTSCGCPTVVVVTGTDGMASSGPATAGSTTGRPALVATVPDPLLAPLPLRLEIVARPA